MDGTNAIKKEKLDPKMVTAALILVAGTFAPLLDSTMVNVAIKSISIDLKSTVATIQWVITGYLLTMGLAVPVSGWAVNRFGGKKVYLFSLWIFLAGSAASALSWNIGSLIAFRLVQGIGAGLLVPTLQTLLVRLSGGRNLGRLIAIISIPALLGPILGPVIGGVIVNSSDWRWIFYIDIPITAAALLLAWLRFPSDKPVNTREPLDVVGLLLLSPAFAVLIYGIVQMSNHGLYSAGTVVPVSAGIILMTAFVVYALLAKRTPVLDLRLFRLPNFRASNIMIFIVGMIRNGIMLLLPLYYQQVQHKSVLFAGLLLIPQGIGMLLTRGWIGKLADRTGPRYIVAASIAFTVLGLLPFAFADAGTNWILLSVGLLIEGMAANGLLIPIMVSAYVELNREQIPHASTTGRILQTIGGAFGAAILATVVQNRISGLAAPNPGAISSAYDTAFRWAIGFASVAFVTSFMLARRKGGPAAEKA